MASAKSPRRGTETRQRQRRVTFRLHDGELAELLSHAERLGMTVGTYIRSRALAAPTTRARRRPSVQLHALVKVQGELNRIGSNVYQLLRHVNFGHLVEGDEVRAAFTGYREAIDALLVMAGRRR